MPYATCGMRRTDDDDDDDDDDHTQIQTGFLCFMKKGQTFEKKYGF